MKMLKHDVLSLLERKRQGKISSSFKQLALETGYTKWHLKKLYKQLDKCSIEELSVHKNTGNPSHNAACSLEIDYIVKFKELYPVISVAQFKDIYEEDVVLSLEYKENVEKYNLQVRSYGFYLDLFHKMNWKSPIKHRTKKIVEEHTYTL